MLGPTTVLSRTEVDATGTSNDAERVSESRRDLKQAPELRRLVKYRQGIAVIDTADPILFRFLQRADVGDVALPPERELGSPQTLADAVATMEAMKESERKKLELRNNGSNTQEREKVTTTLPPERRTATPKFNHRLMNLARIDPKLPFEESN